jgi:hypothetical protein
MKKYVLIVGGLLTAALYVAGLAIMLSQATAVTDASHLGNVAVIGGVLAMFSTVGVFALGFVETATQPS